jgi:hypothetical protein
LYWYAYEKENASSLVPVPVERVREIMEINRKGKKADSLIVFDVQTGSVDEFKDDVGKDSITRFDHKKKKSKKKRKKNRKKNPDKA